MKIQTFSIVVGGKKCNATCPYCVSKMTKGMDNCNVSLDDINIRNFRKACTFAKMSGVSTVLLTGVGEPTLYPNHILKYLTILQGYDFPFIELQTNGTQLELLAAGALPRWYSLGLTIVSLSVAHWSDARNKEIFGREWKSLKNNIKLLHDKGFSVRVSCVMVDDYVDCIGRVLEMIDFCRDNKVEQLTIRPINMPNDSKSKKIQKWVVTNSVLVKIGEYKIANYFKENPKSTLLLELAHGAKVYDYDGQNISINSCLTHTPNPDEVRQLIFQPDGHLRFSWVHKGAIII